MRARDLLKLNVKSPCTLDLRTGSSSTFHSLLHASHAYAAEDGLLLLLSPFETMARVQVPRWHGMYNVYAQNSVFRAHSCKVGEK